jgi:protein SCO1/2
LAATERQAAVSRRTLVLGAGGVVLGLALVGFGAYEATRVGSSPGGLAGGGIGGPFRLEDGDGRVVTEATFRGSYVLLYFGYTFCPDVCPTTLTAVADALDRLGSRADLIKPVFITVDPKRDTQAVVKQYAAAFSPRLIGLTGTPEEIAAVTKEFGVYYAAHAPKPGTTDYTVDHTSLLYLLDRDGKFIAPIPADASGEQIAAALGKYIG